MGREERWQPQVPDDLATPKELAKLLRVTAATVRRWINSGALPGYRIRGRLFASSRQARALVQATGSDRREGA